MDPWFVEIHVVEMAKGNNLQPVILTLIRPSLRQIIAKIGFTRKTVHVNGMYEPAFFALAVSQNFG
jgi:hypothetical protein